MPSSSSTLLEHGITTLKQPQANRDPQDIHLLTVLLTDHLRSWPSTLSYQRLSNACRSLSYAHVPARVRLTDADETGALIFRVLLKGSVLVQRRFGKKQSNWLPIGFLHSGDTLGLPSMLESTPDDVRYTTLGEAAEFAVLRSSDFDRFLKPTFEKEIQTNISVLRSQPAFAQLREQALKQLVSCSRIVSLSAGELLTREGDASDELFVLKSGIVRLVKSLHTSEIFRWPTTKTSADSVENADKEPKDVGAFQDPLSPDALSFKSAPGMSAEEYSVINEAFDDTSRTPRRLSAERVNTSMTGQNFVRRGDYARRQVSSEGKVGGVSGEPRALHAAFEEEVEQHDDAGGPPDAITSRDVEEESACKLFREVARLNHSRIVMVGEMRDGHAFAYDEAIQVIKRIAAARVAKLNNMAPKEQAPIRRNLTAFCMTSVSAIAMSPIILVLFVGLDHLAGFVRSFGPSRTPAMLDEQLRKQRAWHQYKEDLFRTVVNREPTLVRTVIGRRQFPPRVGVNALDAKFEREDNLSLSPRRSNIGEAMGKGRGRDGAKHSLLDGLHSVMNGAASAELAAASSDMGTAFTESTRRRSFLEPSSKPRLLPMTR